MASGGLPTVAVLDVALPPGLAFLRSLGRRGIPLRTYASKPRPAGRYSRYSGPFAAAPSPLKVGEFHRWLAGAAERHEFDLIAPTSDYVAFAVAEFDREHGTHFGGGIGGDLGAEAVRDCLFKDRFAARLDRIGFPAPAWATPESPDEAAALAGSWGYPAVVKPKSHVGIGIARGDVVRDADALRAAFAPYAVIDRDSEALRSEPSLAMPFLQQMIERPNARVVSISGFLDGRGGVHGLEYVAKAGQWGDELSIGVSFESVPAPSFSTAAVDVAQQVLGHGIFEFEVLVDADTGEYWAIELNPRGFGQMSLSIARGSDLPALWYGDATGLDVSQPPPPRRLPSEWRFGVPYYAGAVVRLLRGPGRVRAAGSLSRDLRTPTAGAVHSWRDPLPGLVFTGALLRRPGGLVRPFLRRT